MSTDAEKNTTYNPALMHYERMKTLWRLKHADYRQKKEEEWRAKTAVDHLDKRLSEVQFASMGPADFAQHYLALVKQGDDAVAALGALTAKYDAEFDAANKHLLEG